MVADDLAFLEHAHVCGRFPLFPIRNVRFIRFLGLRDEDFGFVHQRTLDPASRLSYPRTQVLYRAAAAIEEITTYGATPHVDLQSVCVL